MARTASFGEGASKVWSSSGSSFLSPRSTTDDALWSRLRPAKSDRLKKKRFSSYTFTSDFEVNESDQLVDIDTSMLCRLPDRTKARAGEDVFGRRRGDFDSTCENLCEHQEGAVSAYDIGAIEGDDGPGRHRPTNNPVVPQVPGEQPDEDETIKTISKAIDSSRGRLRKSANMSRAFKAVIRSGEGWVRKSEVIQATMDSEDSKDPSMIILLDPSSCDPANPHVEGVSTTSEESGSADVVSNNNDLSSASIGFSTSMTAKQCAATLETLLREMSCKVSRYPDTEHGSRQVIRLRVVRIPHGARKLDRKLKIMVTIREEDHIRTSVSFKRIAGLYSSRDSHIPLCTDIRDRFQREWPAVVEALYIRFPNTNNISKR